MRARGGVRARGTDRTNDMTPHTASTPRLIGRVCCLQTPARVRKPEARESRKPTAARAAGERGGHDCTARHLLLECCSASTVTIRLIRDGHLHFHTPPELRSKAHVAIARSLAEVAVTELRSCVKVEVAVLGSRP